LAPALFEPDEAGFASVKVVDVPAEQLDQALLAVNSCPEVAIRLRPTS
jgi:ferredoxin